MEASQIIREIVREFRQVVEPELRRTGPSGWTEYTRQILTGLCRVGQRLGYSAYAAKVTDEHRDGPEWLYDTTWLELDDAGRMKSIPLVAECEWGSQGEAEDDLQKLLVARADASSHGVRTEKKARPPSAGVVGGLSGRARRHLPVDRLYRRRWGLSVRVRASPRCGAGSATKTIKIVIGAIFSN